MKYNIIYSKKILYKNSEPVINFNKIKDLIKNMINIMYKYKGIGLSAIQIGIPKQIFVININFNKPIIFINPKIFPLNYKKQFSLEGCISLPNVYSIVKRFKLIKVNAYDICGNYFSLIAKNILSNCIQHEYDHLNGKLFIKYNSKYYYKY